MASKYVRDTKGGKAIRAIVILDKRGKYVAKVQAHFSDNPNGSVCLVNIWQTEKAAQACLKTQMREEIKAKRAKPSSMPIEDFGRAAYDRFSFQHGKAGGYGYDKYTAALSHLWIDGIRLSDHCGEQLKPPKGAKVFPRDYAAPKGYRLANFVSAKNCESRGLPPETEGYTSCHRDSGLDYLKAIGYQIIEAI